MFRGDSEIIDSAIKKLSSARQLLREDLPTTGAQLVSYQLLLSQHEQNLMDLKLDLSLRIAELSKSFDDALRETIHEDRTPPNKITNHYLLILKLEPVLTDLDLRIESLKAYSESLDSYLWQLRDRKRLSEGYVKVLGQM